MLSNQKQLPVTDNIENCYSAWFRIGDKPVRADFLAYDFFELMEIKKIMMGDPDFMGITPAGMDIGRVAPKEKIR